MPAIPCQACSAHQHRHSGSTSAFQQLPCCPHSRMEGTSAARAAGLIDQSTNREPSSQGAAAPAHAAGKASAACESGLSSGRPAACEPLGVLRRSSNARSASGAASTPRCCRARASVRGTSLSPVRLCLRLPQAAAVAAWTCCPTLLLAASLLTSNRASLLGSRA